MISVDFVKTSEVEEMLDILSESAARLHAKGLDQWPVRFRVAKVMPDIENRYAYFVRGDEGLLATFILSPEPDRDFWTPVEISQPSRYVSKLATRDGFSGVGAAILDWCEQCSARSGAKWLRLDAWRTNSKLHDYYKAQGFEHLRTVAPPGRNSGALFQRAAHDRASDRMTRLGLASPTPELCRC